MKENWRKIRIKEQLRITRFIVQSKNIIIFLFFFIVIFNPKVVLVRLLETAY